MNIVADLHLHSHYARAVSKYMDLQEIARWSACKGVDLAATGDWTHPKWLAQIEEELCEVRPGILQLRQVAPEQRLVMFLLSTEISCIYYQDGHLKRCHHLVLSPSLASCRAINTALEQHGADLTADGRPNIALSSHDLLELLLTIDSNVVLIPAHIWTPWFGTLGARSGFNSLQACFGDLMPYIYAVETGLSSDPAMNWQVAELDSRSIVSFSDAHSGPKIAREATVLTGPEAFTYQDVIGALQQKSTTTKIAYTIEFFPEEGKYHWSGHRSHDIRFSPEQDQEHRGVCPVCHRPLTMGVENRVRQLATNSALTESVANAYGVSMVHPADHQRPPYISVVPLLEILQEIHQGSPTRAQRAYDHIMQSGHTELEILLELPLLVIAELQVKFLAEAIQRLRERKVVVDPGYDGVFGQVKILQETIH